MKKLILATGLVSALTCAAQTGSTTPATGTSGGNTAAQTPVPGSQTPVAPPQYPLPGSPNAGQRQFVPQTYPTAPGYGNVAPSTPFATNQSAANTADQTNVFQSGNFGLVEVQGLFQNLQAQLEQAIPVLARMTAANAGTDPRTGLPNQLVGAAVRGVNPSSYLATAGTNTLQVDPQSYHLMVVLQNHLQQTLMSLRDMNASPFIANAQQQLNQNGTLTPTGVNPSGTPPTVAPGANSPAVIPADNNVLRNRILQPGQRVPQNIQQGAPAAGGQATPGGAR